MKETRSERSLDSSKANFKKCDWLVSVASRLRTGKDGMKQKRLAIWRMSKTPYYDCESFWPEFQLAVPTCSPTTVPWKNVSNREPASRRLLCFLPRFDHFVVVARQVGPTVHFSEVERVQVPVGGQLAVLRCNALHRQRKSKNCSSDPTQHFWSFFQVSRNKENQRLWLRHLKCLRKNKRSNI